MLAAPGEKGNLTVIRQHLPPHGQVGSTDLGKISAGHTAGRPQVISQEPQPVITALRLPDLRP